jgi:hypothetical protein
LTTGIVPGNEHVGRFHVAVDDALMVGVLHGLANGHKQFQPFARRQLVLVAERGDGHAFNKFHDEIRPARRGFPAIKNVRDVRMIHERQSLPFRLEARHYLTRIHARFEDL